MERLGEWDRRSRGQTCCERLDGGAKDMEEHGGTEQFEQKKSKKFTKIKANSTVGAVVLYEEKQKTPRGS